MRRRILAFGMLSAALLAGVAGCGIPEQTDVRVDGRVPMPGDNPDDGGDLVMPRREEAADTKEFVANFLQAPAGEVASAYDRVNDYITPGSWFRAVGDETVINVVRLTAAIPTSQKDGTTKFTLSVQHVGVLRADGTLGEPVTREQTYTITVGKIEGNPRTQNGTSRGYYVLKPPPLLLMTADALEKYYHRRTIYFWNSNQTALIPDLRYLPYAVPSRRDATEVLDWLIGGPAQWLTSTAARLPEGTEAIGNVPDPQPKGRLEVNLSMPAEAVDDENELGKLFEQLVWSIPDRISAPRDLELKIQGKSRKVANIETYRRSRPPYRVVGEPVGFVIKDRQVRSLDGGREAVPLTAERNRDVVSAALNRDGVRTWAALVTEEGDGRRRLRTGAGPAAVRELQPSKPYDDSLGQPVWLKSSDPVHPAGLVVAKGKLWRFDVNANMTEVTVPDIPAKPLIAVAAALDGHRIALVVQGVGLYVAGLSVESDSVTVGPARSLATSLTDLTAVSWDGEDSLAVAGRRTDGRVVICSTRVDAARESEVINEVAGPVTQLAAYPGNPVVKAKAGNTLYIYSTGTAVYSNGELIELDDPAPGMPGTALSSPFFYY